MLIVRDEIADENFAVPIDITSANIPPITRNTELILLEAIGALKCLERSDIDDFSPYSNTCYYLFQGELIKPSLSKRRHASVEC
jgi:hypothetical protein